MNDQIVLNRKDLEEMVRLYATAWTSSGYSRDTQHMFQGAVLILLEFLGVPEVVGMNLGQRENLEEDLINEDLKTFEEVVEAWTKQIRNEV